MTGRLIRRLGRDRRGSFSVELALAIPLVMFMMLTTLEMSRFMLVHAKVNRLVAQISDLVGRLPTNVTEDMITNTFDAAEHITRPFPFGQNGRIIISSVSPNLSTATPNDGIINWQRCSGQYTSAASVVGVEGGAATLPNGFAVPEQQNAIVAEAYFQFEPLLFERFFVWQVFDSSQKTIYHFFVNPVRLGVLEAVQTGGAISSC